jgi:hypothetical protein
MTAALLSLAKDKKEKKKEKGEKATNLLVAANVVRCRHATLQPILCNSRRGGNRCKSVV